MEVPAGSPAEGGGSVDKDKGGKPVVESGTKVEGTTVDKDAEAKKKEAENQKRTAEIEAEMKIVDQSLNNKEQELAKVVEDFKKIPVPVDPDNSEETVRYDGKTGFQEARQKYAKDKPEYDLKKQAYDKKVADLQKDMMALQRKKVDLALEQRTIDSKVDERTAVAVSEMKREAMKDELEAGKIKFLDGLMTRLDAAKIAERRQEFKINADKWDVTSVAGLASWKKDLVDLKIYENTPFFNGIFEQLARLSDPTELNTLKPGEDKMYSSVEEKKKIFLKPEENVKKIGDKALSAAVSFFIAVKDLLKTQDNLQMTAEAQVQGKDQDKIASTGIKFVTDNLKKFQDAIKEKDWGTALVYVVAGYAAYKGAMKIWEKTPDLAKDGLYAAGFLYAVNLFSKNAGYDIGKKLGITAAEDEVRGTSLSYLYRLNVPESKDMDGRVLLDIGGTSVSDLNSLYNESNSSVIRSIDPNAISPSPFPQFRGMSPSVLNKTTHLNSKEEEYQRVGRELYKIAKVVRDSYDKHIKPKNGLTIEQALGKDPDLKGVSLFNFAMLFRDVAGTDEYRVAGGLLGESLGFNLASLKMRKRFEAVFQDKQMDFEAVHTPLERGVYKAQVMNFPIVIREDAVSNEYVVFSLDDYQRANGNPNAATQALCKIPFEGNADAQVSALKDAIIDRFTKVVKELNKTAKDSLSLGDVKYQNGKFVSTLKVEKGSMLGAEKTIPVFLKVSKDGSTVEVYNSADSELIINLDSSGDKNKLLGNLVIAELGQQDNMKPFFFLYKAKKLEYKGENPDKSFTVLAGDSKVEIKFKLNKATGRYEFAEAGAEAKLFNAKNYGFLRELAENAVRENKDLKRATMEFAKVLDNVPEEYIANLFKNAPNWWKDATWYKPAGGFSLDQFTGSIPKNYTNAMLGSQIEFLISRLTSEIVNGGSLNKANALVSNDSDIKKAVYKIDAISTKLSDLKEDKERKKEAFDADFFKKEILDDVSRVAVKSETYSLWYQQFATHIFMKFGKDDLLNGRVVKAGKVLSVFAEYTKDLDDPWIEKRQKKDSKGKPVLDSEGEPVYENITMHLDRLRVSDQEYKLRAGYSNYVATRMFKKINIEGDKLPDPLPTKGSTPDFWSIASWEDYKADPSKYKADSSFEHTAEMEALKQSKDYVEFDAWLGNKSLLKPGKKLILPRKNCKFTLTSVADLKAFRALLSEEDPYHHEAYLADGTHEEYDLYPTSEYTDLEKGFRNSMKKALAKVKKEYEGDYIPEAFDELEYEIFDFGFQSTPKPDGIKLNVPIDFKLSEYTRFVEEIDDIKQELRKVTVPLTKSIQRKAIEDKVSKLIKEEIINEDNFHRYFKSKTVWERIAEKYEKIKNKLF